MMENETPAAFVPLLMKYGAKMSIENVCEVLRVTKCDLLYVINKKRLLVPLGNPKPNSVKWFCTHTLSVLVGQDAWMQKVMRALQQSVEERSQ